MRSSPLSLVCSSSRVRSCIFCLSAFPSLAAQTFAAIFPARGDAAAKARDRGRDVDGIRHVYVIDNRSANLLPVARQQIPRSVTMAWGVEAVLSHFTLVWSVPQYLVCASVQVDAGLRAVHLPLEEGRAQRLLIAIERG